MSALGGIIRVIDSLSEATGRAIAWLTLLMVIITFVVVVMRYVFTIGFVWMQESYVWLHGVVFMAGAGYTLLHEGHVRVDILYRAKSARYKAWVDVFGVLFLLLPVIVLVWWVAWPYVAAAWERYEGSREAGGLPGLFLLKTVILVFCVAIGLQGISLALRSLLILAGHTEYIRANGDNETEI